MYARGLDALIKKHNGGLSFSAFSYFIQQNLATMEPRNALSRQATGSRTPSLSGR